MQCCSTESVLVPTTMNDGNPARTIQEQAEIPLVLIKDNPPYFSTDKNQNAKCNHPSNALPLLPLKQLSNAGRRHLYLQAVGHSPGPAGQL